ncbi:MAG: hypothetical protein IIB00_08480 [candidate division Zixibacteria bacterium]|nr:hypothetical protein [candidate division Zixibacteria bacterium]
MARRIKRRNGRSDERFIDRVYVRIGSKALIGIVVAILFLSLIQCSIEKPESPSWVTSLNLPLMNRQYDMPELIERIDEPTLSVDSLGNPQFLYEQDLDSIGVGPSMTVSDISRTVSEALGEIQVNLDQIPPSTVSFADLLSYPIGVIPPVSFDFIHDTPVMTTFDSMTIAVGSILISIQNNLGLTLDTVSIELFDLVTFLPISAGMMPGGLPAGATDTIEIPLTNNTISNRLRLQVHAHTIGGTLLSLSDKDITTQIFFSDPFTISRGSVQIPEITKNFVEVVALDAAHRIDSATLVTGELKLVLANKTGVSANMIVSLPDFVLNGASLTLSSQVAASSVDTILVDVSAYTLAPSDQTLPQDISILIDVVIDSSAPGTVTISATDTIRVIASIRNLSFDRIKGVFSSVTTILDPIVETIDIPTGFDSVQLTAATLTLGIENGSKLSGSLNIVVNANNGKSLNITGTIQPGSRLAPQLTEIVESDIAAFLNPIPSEFTVSGSVTFGDGTTVVEVTASDFIRSSIKIESPLELAITSSTVEGDISSSTIDTADIKIITDHLIEARLNATITNRLPLGLTVNLLLSGDSATLYSAPELVVGPITVVPSPVDVNGIAIDSVSSSVVIVLDSVDIQILMNDTLYIGQLITLQSAGGQPVRLVAADYIIVNASAEIDYKFNGEF